jgi:hypothetical protein
MMKGEFHAMNPGKLFLQPSEKGGIVHGDQQRQAFVDVRADAAHPPVRKPCQDRIRQRQDSGFVHLYAGEEAVAVGICAHLTDADYMTSTHRGHGHCVAKGVDPRGMMAELFGKATGTCKGKGGSMHIADMDKGMLGANGPSPAAQG